MPQGEPRRTTPKLAQLNAATTVPAVATVAGSNGSGNGANSSGCGSGVQLPCCNGNCNFELCINIHIEMAAMLFGVLWQAMWLAGGVG